MPRTVSDSTLGQMIAALRAQRQQYVDSIAQIDAQFAANGISVASSPKKPGRPPGRPAKAQAQAVPAAGKGRRRKRGRFEQTAEQFVLEFVKVNPGATTAQVNEAWKAAKRGGTANVPLGKLVKDGKLKREKVAEGRGSSFAVV